MQTQHEIVTPSYDVVRTARAPQGKTHTPPSTPPSLALRYAHGPSDRMWDFFLPGSLGIWAEGTSRYILAVGKYVEIYRLRERLLLCTFCFMQYRRERERTCGFDQHCFFGLKLGANTYKYTSTTAYYTGIDFLVATTTTTSWGRNHKRRAKQQSLTFSDNVHTYTGNGDTTESSADAACGSEGAVYQSRGTDTIPALVSRL